MALGRKRWLSRAMLITSGRRVGALFLRYSASVAFESVAGPFCRIDNAFSKLESMSFTVDMVCQLAIGYQDCSQC